MGHTLRGQMYLFPEEALYLVDRGSLLAEHQGLDMTVQEMWSVYFNYAHISYQNQGLRCPHDQESTLAMDRYLVYSYLKRLGFIVIRPGTYTQEADIRTRRQTSSTPSSTLWRPSHSASFFSVLCSWILGTWKNVTGLIVSRIGMFLKPIDGFWTGAIRRPLVAQGERLNYGTISLAPAATLMDSIRSFSSLVRVKFNIQQRGGHQARGLTKRDVDFEVYKPGGTFKKRQPGIPDYRVVVTRSSTPLPSLGDLSGYMDGQFDPASESPDSNVAPPAVSDKGKKSKAPDWPKVLFAIVDGGQVSFISLFNIKAVP
ncbi:tRNA splicing endonuclease 54 [Mortierella alpina]|nr:tRNA splicing endonuclease 54 [Mortierella alpina]